MKKKVKNLYHQGYRYLPETKNEEWQYAIQAHRNQNGLHYDIRLARPGETHAYSWSTKKLPIKQYDKPILARRTKDHSRSFLEFEGPISTSKGYGKVKMLKKGIAKIKKINDEGIFLNLDSDTPLVISNVKGKKYMIKKGQPE